MKTIITTISILLATVTSFAQLRGSGKIITKTYDYQNFNKVSFDDLDGKLEIQVGKPYSVSITIDDNLVNLLLVTNKPNQQELNIALSGNRNNRKYIENSNIYVVISMPNLEEVTNNGNANLKVANIKTQFFKVTNPENGSTTLQGTVENLEVLCRGNGNLYADKLVTKNAKVNCKGNGNAKVNASESITANASGNGNIQNIGNAKFSSDSKSTGNGSLNGKKNK